MARLVTAGGEIRGHPTTDIGSTDGWTPSTIPTATDAATFRSGFVSWLCAGTTTGESYRAFAFTAPALGADLFARAYFEVDVLPSVETMVAAFVTAADAALISARLDPSGVLRLYNDAAGTQIGSDTALVVVPATSYRVQLRLRIGSGAVDQAEMRVQLDEEQATEEIVSGSALSISDTHGGRFRSGWVGAPGAVANLWLDDVAVNDSTGTAQNSWPGSGRVVWAKPTNTTSVASWTDCSGGTTQVVNCLNKTPPIGLADHSTAGHTGATAHQTRCAQTTSQTMSVICQMLASAGVPFNLDLLSGGSPVAGVTTAVGDAAARRARAQSFIYNTPVTINSVTLELLRTGTPTDGYVVEIQSDAGGFPTGAALAASAPVSVTSVVTTGAGTQLVFPLAPALPIDAGTVYHIVLRRAGAIDAANYVSLGRLTAGDYVDGLPSVYDESTSTWLQSGTNWTALDHLIKVSQVQPQAVVKTAAGAIAHGEAATGVKGGTLTLQFQGGTGGGSGVHSFNYADDVGIAGTYPTNWRWAQTGPWYNPRFSLTTTVPVMNLLIAKQATATAAAVDVCAAGVVLEYDVPAQGWARYQKTADSTFWWAKQAWDDSTAELAGGTLANTSAGDWLAYPDPQIGAGSDLPSTTVTVANDAFQTGYTAA